jgi:uncharacterized protein
MRTFLSLCVALLWALWLVFPAQSTEHPPLTVAVYGDSLGEGLWQGLYLLLKSDSQTRVVRRSKLGSGLTRGDYSDWFEDFKAELDKAPPDIAVIMFGANDQQSLRDASRKGYLFATEGWKTVYASRVDAIMNELKNRHVQTAWIGLPIMRKDELNKGARLLDAIFEAEAARDQVMFLPLNSEFTDESGNFVTYVSDASKHSRQVRSEDGVHFTGYGYGLVAERVWAQIQEHREPAPESAPSH